VARYNPKTAERRAYAYRRRGEDATYREIAEELGCSHVRARQLYLEEKRRLLRTVINP
jgi:hypothetical protein